MGCMQSVANKNKVAPVDTNFEVFTNVKAVIDHSPTVVDESSPIVLRYRTPFFRAHAQVIFPPIEKKEMWTIGWIQACDDMKFINQYGELGLYEINFVIVCTKFDFYQRTTIKMN